MKHVLFAALVMGGSAISHGAEMVNPDPVAADRAAKAAFEQTTFFSDGRGMHLSPGLITHFNDVMSRAPAPRNSKLDLRTWFTKRWGLNFKDKHVVGLFDVEYKDMQIGAIGCVACHSSRAAGELIIGLGNKNIDVVQMAKDVYRLERWWQRLVPEVVKSADYKDVEASALNFSGYLANEDIGNLTQGLVPISFIRGWFYRIHNEELPEKVYRGQVKIPHFWGYEKKREAGLFTDGYGDGDKVGWALAVELAAGQKPEVIRKLYDKAHAAELLFNQFLPPKYPFEIDQNLADRGRELFNQTCAKCHGSYVRDSEGFPIYRQPKHIPWRVVRTDEDRILGNTPEFNRKVEQSPLSDIIRYTTLGYGYFAPRLDGVWSRFPYLHNASVPNVRALLTRPSQRPKFFSLTDTGERHRFSEKNLGLTLPKSRAARALVAVRARAGHRGTYSTEREGHSNQGHDFYTDLPKADKDSLIEYLKTL